MTRPFSPRKAIRWLALLAALLIAVMPTASRIHQAVAQSDGLEAMCTAAGLRHVLPGAFARRADPLGIAGHQRTAPAGQERGSGKPGHPGGEACDYCVLAAGLLPLLALLACLLPGVLPATIPRQERPALRLAARWPAHAARGPPLIA